MLLTQRSCSVRSVRGVWVTCALALTGLASLAGGGACTVAGSCELSEANYCNAQSSVACTGHLVDAHTWESSRPGQDWLPFEGERRWHMSLRDGQTGALIAGRPFEVQVYVSTTSRPEDPGGSFALAAGNLALVHVWCTQNDAYCTQLIAGEPLVDVQNDTCSGYFVKVVVRSEPDASDAGADR